MTHRLPPHPQPLSHEGRGEQEALAPGIPSGWALAWLLVSVLPGLAGESKPSAEQIAFFEAKIQPVLVAHCYRCHSDQTRSPRGGLRLDSREALLKGGDTGPAIVPGKPEASLLLRAVRHTDRLLSMPPKEKLPDQTVADIEKWIALGAPASEAYATAKHERPHWAFQPPQRPAVPHPSDSQRVRNPIDAFLLARLEAKGLSFNQEASREVLLRRLSFDLLGLPPTPEEREEFLADDRPDAYERLVDRMLASPAYGERWGRHWLDMAGYADSDGYLAADRLRPEAWRYRDYVINALNDDMPYDQFLTEQLAGDELSDWRRAEELTPDMVRQLTATGFLRTALDPTYPGYTEPNEIHQVLSDTMQIMGSTFLGLTIQCARCHSHKLEPITQRDYYALEALLLPALDPARWQPSSVRGIPLASEAEQARCRTRNQKVAERINELNQTLKELTARYQKKYQASHPEEKKKPGAADLAARFPEYRAEAEKLRQAIAAEQALKKTPTLLRGLMDLEGPPPQGRILQRGDYRKPGDKVDPGVLEVLAPAGYTLPIEPGYKTSGRRLALARWLANPQHPLTARVQVNRMWAHHFGQGIVKTVANFGRSGARPTHPQLLDWLAEEFIRTGWSQKALHRLMVTSTAYRQSSDRDEIRASRDPENKLLSSWKPRRHEGEVLRDSILAVSDKLRTTRFGPPVPVVRHGDSSIQTRDDAQGNRRSLYLIVRRSQHLTLLELFDTPMMEINCPQRTVSTVPLQALALMHSPFAEGNAAALADRILREAPQDNAARITFAYHLLFARDPRPTEVEKIQHFVQALGEGERAAWVQTALVLLNSNEFIYVH
jgi:hypothetical protein